MEGSPEMPDTPTNWELHRNVEQLRRDMHDGFQGIAAQLAQLPTTALLNSLAHDLGRLEARIDRDNEQRSTDRRLIWSAFLVAVLSFGGSVALKLLG
jgi:hypothetical protein